MHKDLQRRYPSVEALLRDIDHYLKDEPLQARPDSLRYRFRKFAVRNRRVLSATVAVCAIIVALVTFFVVRLSRERSTALAEARRTQRIERFMLNLFDNGDASAGPSSSLLAVSLLDRGVQSAQGLKADPAVQADLYETLGQVYRQLGKFDQADPLLRSALDRRKSLTGPDSPEAAANTVELGLLRLDQGQPAEAERLVRAGLAMDRRHLPADDPAVAKDMSALGHVLEERGSYGEAVKILDDTVRIQSAQPEEAADLSESLNVLANAHYYLAQWSDAQALFQRALGIDRGLYGAVHPHVAGDYYGLGLIAHSVGHYVEAERDYRQALAIYERWYGKDHPNTVLLTAAVGQALTYQGRYDEAAPLLQEAVAMQERIFGKVHPEVAQGLNTLGMFELGRGHFKDADADFTRVTEINRSIYGAKHLLVGAGLMNLGEAYMGEHQNARAEKSFRDALECFRETLPPGHAYPAKAHVRLGHLLVMERRYKEAESPLLSGVDVLTKQPGPPGPSLQTARKDLVTVYEALNQPEQAKKFQDH